VARQKGRQLQAAARRVRLLVRALSAFYAAVGSFAAATLASLLGAAFVIARVDAGRDAGMEVASVCGVLGIVGLVAGAAFRVRESRLTLTTPGTRAIGSGIGCPGRAAWAGSRGVSGEQTGRMGA
jgi:hypothetical protein